MKNGSIADMHTYIVTVTAADRVGIVFSVAGTLRDHGGNILELSQTVMRGYFTIILAVEFDGPRDPKSLGETIRERGKRFDLTVAVIEAKNGAVEPTASSGDRFILTVLGDDQPGNIHGIAGCLAAHGVNIVDLHARVVGNRFSLVMEAFLPPDLSPATVRAELERFGRDHGLEAYVQHENIFLATNEPSPVRVGPHRTQGDSVVPH
jgi:glycine cleavage system transcriptional repressor